MILLCGCLAAAVPSGMTWKPNKRWNPGAWDCSDEDFEVLLELTIDVAPSLKVCLRASSGGRYETPPLVRLPSFALSL